MEKEPLVTSPAAYPTKPAILSNCAALILGHNHPSGDPQPSLDHLVIGAEGRYFSFADEGLLP
jgi:DNA repair protein RadC